MGGSEGLVKRDEGDEAGTGTEDAGEFSQVEWRAGVKNDQVEGEVGEHGEFGGRGLDAADATLDAGVSSFAEGGEHDVARGVQDGDFCSGGGQPDGQRSVASAVEKDAAAWKGLRGDEVAEECRGVRGFAHGR